jgi:hypothetical protein
MVASKLILPSVPCTSLESSNGNITFHKHIIFGWDHLQWVILIILTMNFEINIKKNLKIEKKTLYICFFTYRLIVF